MTSRDSLVRVCLAITATYWLVVSITVTFHVTGAQQTSDTLVDIGDYSVTTAGTVQQ